MNLDELQSVQSRERQTDSLQQLRESFYEDAGAYIQQLREERDRAAERADDPFDAPEVNRLTDDINTAEQTVEAIYERRVGKIVKMASLAAADMPTEEEGLTREERDLFETLVGAIEDNRDHVLDVLAGEASPGAVAGGSSPSQDTPDGPATDSESASPAESASDPVPEPSDGDGGSVDAAEVMGSGAGSVEADGETDAPREVPPDNAPPEATPSDDPLASDPDTPASDGGAAPAPPDDAPAESSPDARASEEEAVDRTTVRITDDVGEIFGVDQREYDLSTDDVVTLPEQNAAPLVERDAAEKLDDA